MAHGVVLFQDSHHLGHLALLLADGDVHADKIAAPLVDDGVQRNGGLAGGTVADDQLPLAAADGNHGVDGLDAGLHRGIHRLAHHHVGGHLFHGAGAAGVDGTLAVQGSAQRVNHPADEGIAHGNFDNLAGGTDLVALFDSSGITEDGRAHQVGLQVKGQSKNFVAEVQQLVGTYPLETLDAGDTVTHLDHGTHIHHAQIAAKFFDLAPD